MPQASNSTFMLYTQAQAIQENEFTSSSKINMVIKFKTKHVICVDLKWKGRHKIIIKIIFVSIVLIFIQGNLK